jgi:hypothetical protein
MSADLRARIAALNWYHRLPIGDQFTPGARDVGELYRFLRLPKDLRGRRVLDIGTFDGGLAFACEARNADEVVALDVVEHKTFTLPRSTASVRIGLSRTWFPAVSPGLSRRNGLIYCAA